MNFSMQRSNPKSSLAFRRLVMLELQRSAKHGIALVCSGIVAPWAAVRFRSDSVELLGVTVICVLMMPLACAANANFKDKLSGDLDFLKSLPVSGNIHACARVMAIFLYTFSAVALISPYLWPGYVWTGGEGLAGFVFATSGVCIGTWVATSLLSAITLRFDAQKFFMWSVAGIMALGFGAGDFLDPLLEPYLDLDTLQALLAWSQSPVGAVVAIAAFATVSAALIAISLRWMRTAVETYRREDNIMRF